MYDGSLELSSKDVKYTDTHNCFYALIILHHRYVLWWSHLYVQKFDTLIYSYHKIYVFYQLVFQNSIGLHLIIAVCLEIILFTIVFHIL